MSVSKPTETTQSTPQASTLTPPKINNPVPTLSLQTDEPAVSPSTSPSTSPREDIPRERSKSAAAKPASPTYYRRGDVSILFSFLRRVHLVTNLSNQYPLQKKLWAVCDGDPKDRRRTRMDEKTSQEENEQSAWICRTAAWSVIINVCRIDEQVTRWWEL